MNIDDYLGQLEAEIEHKNQEIEERRRRTDQILAEADERAKEAEKEIFVTSAQPTNDPSPQTRKQYKTEYESATTGAAQPPQPASGAPMAIAAVSKEQQRQMNALAAQMAQNGVEQEVAAKLGPGAETIYLQTKVKNLEKIVREQNEEHQRLLQKHEEARESAAVFQAQRDRLQKQLTTSTQRLSAATTKAEQLEAKNATLQAQLQDRDEKASKTSKLAQMGALAAQGKEKQVQRLLEQVDALKKQVSAYQEREVLLKEQLDGAAQASAQGTKKLQRENEELQTIVKKQQLLIDVLQRQKLHLQGALQLGLTEAEFQKILEK